MTKQKEVPKKSRPQAKKIFDYDTNAYPGEDIDYETDLTPQGQGMSMQEMLHRFTRGESLPVGRKVYYDGKQPTEEDIDPTLRPDYDLVDASNDYRHAKQSINEKYRLEQLKKAQEAEKKEKAETPKAPEPPSGKVDK